MVNIKTFKKFTKIKPGAEIAKDLARDKINSKVTQLTGVPIGAESLLRKGISLTADKFLEGEKQGYKPCPIEYNYIFSLDKPNAIFQKSMIKNNLNVFRKDSLEYGNWSTWISHNSETKQKLITHHLDDLSLIRLSSTSSSKKDLIQAMKFEGFESGWTKDFGKKIEKEIYKRFITNAMIEYFDDQLKSISKGLKTLSQNKNELLCLLSTLQTESWGNDLKNYLGSIGLGNEADIKAFKKLKHEMGNKNIENFIPKLLNIIKIKQRTLKNSTKSVKKAIRNKSLGMGEFGSEFISFLLKRQNIEINKNCFLKPNHPNYEKPDTFLEKTLVHYCNYESETIKDDISEILNFSSGLVKEPQAAVALKTISLAFEGAHLYDKYNRNKNMGTLNGIGFCGIKTKMNKEVFSEHFDL